jgi:2-polyprenyl-3-methyl-5-hydroxy-6-metoxy-1,4-benzoquinol methylase
MILPADQTSEVLETSEVFDESDALPLDWEETGCLLCGSRQTRPLVEAPDVHGTGSGPRFQVVRCNDCGLCFTNPRPSPASIGRFYRSDYEPHQGCGLSERQRHRARWRRHMPEFWRARHPAGRGLPWHGQGRLLDFGCGSGAFLELMHLQGWRVLGLDISQETVGRIRRELNLPALAGTLPHPELRRGQFDVVSMWHSLEHVHRPLDVLKHARDLLAPGGELVVGVPNIAGGPFRWFGPAWFCLDLPRHLTHFSPSTLRRMVEAAGFRVERVRMLRASDWLCRSARRAQQGQHPGPRWLRFRPLARLAASYLCWTGQSDSMLLTAIKGKRGLPPSEARCLSPLSVPSEARRPSPGAVREGTP